MQRNLMTVVRGFKCQKSVLFLAFFWVSGIVVGLYLARSMQDISVSLMRAAVFGRVSIVSLVTVLFLPFLLSAAAFYFSLYKLIYFFGTVKGICFGFNTYILLVCYSNAAWLMYFLIFFSDICTLIPLFLYWIRHIDGTGDCLQRDTVRCLLYAALIVAAEYSFIAPFVSSVIGS